MMRSDSINKFKHYFDQIERTGKDDLYEWLISTDFFDAPASSMFHSNYDGGLVDHSINVLEIFLNSYKFLVEEYQMCKIKKDTIYLITLLHDLCKINSYNKELCWYKLNNKWESYEGYKLTESVYGHGESSVRMIEKYIQLTDEEAIAIKYHMGIFESNEKNVWRAFNQYPIARLLHTCDMMSLCVEKTISYK